MSEVSPRVALHDALREAAVVEQQLCLQYLYAAASLQWRPPADASPEAQVAHERARGAAMTLLLLARQEMEHQGWVHNLLVATGATPPAFDAPPMPHRLPFGGPARLQAFSRDALVRFIAYERPDHLDDPAGPCAAPPDLVLALQAYEEEHPRSGDPAHAAILDHYVALYKALVRVAAEDPPLVTDTWGRQVTTGDDYDVSLGSVGSLTDALAAVDQIVLEGEGGSAASLWWSLTDEERQQAVDHGVPVDGPSAPATTTPDRSHYCRLVELWSLVSGAEVDVPVLDVPTDPTLDPAVGGDGLITHPYSVEVAEVAEAVHGVVLDGLRISWGAHLPAMDALALSEVAFFQSMTMCVRPLLMVLARLPRTSEPHDPRRAGMTFRAVGRFHGSYAAPAIEARSSVVKRLRTLSDALGRLVDGTPPPDSTIDADLVTQLLDGLRYDLGRIGDNLAADSTSPLGVPS